jgi:hypothetical protein
MQKPLPPGERDRQTPLAEIGFERVALVGREAAGG